MEATHSIDFVPRPARARPRFSAGSGFRKQLELRVADYFEKTGQSRHADWRMYLKTAIILAWFGGSYALLVFAATTWWEGVLCATSLAFAVAGIGFSIQHDANHDAYSRHRVVNRMLERTLDMLGASSYLWRWRHNIFHHTYTNLHGADNNIDLAPYARLAPMQRWRWIHRFQYIYMWALYGFSVYDIYWEDIVNIKRGRVGEQPFPKPTHAQLLEMAVSKLFLVGWALVIPMLLHPWWIVLAFYAATWFVVGLILGIVFQLAHCYDGVEFPEPDPDTNCVEDSWAIHQMKTTADFAPDSWLVSWYVGGLNFQIEHHLFPKVCHVHYPHLAGIVRAVCAEYGVCYTSYDSLTSAIAAHGRLLRRMGSCPNLA